MGENSAIPWTDATFNPWRGCVKVSDGCAGCYAETNVGVKLHGVTWGPVGTGTRVVSSESYWRKPEVWNRKAQQAGVRRRVFCASLGDVFEDWSGPMVDRKGQHLILCPNCGIEPYYGNDGEKGCTNDPLTMNDVRRRLFELIDATPWLDWLLVTKRPENIRRFWPMPTNGRDPSADDYLRRDNVWLLTSVENQAAADARIPRLLECRDLAPVLGLSCEPLIGPVTFRISVDHEHPSGDPTLDWTTYNYPLTGFKSHTCGGWTDPNYKIDWVIVGGESGKRARPCRIEWIDQIRRDCEAACVPVYIKQMGAMAESIEPTAWDWPAGVSFAIADGDLDTDGGASILLAHPKGGDPNEWPGEFRKREFPTVPTTEDTESTEDAGHR